MRVLATRGGPRGAGFTLIELVVAITIAVTLLATVPVALGRAYDTMAYRAAVRNILAGLKSARQEAARRGYPVSFTMDLDSRSFGVDGRPRSDLPESLEVRAVVAEVEIQPGGSAGIRFYPDGGATGGSIELHRPSGGGVRLRVDWLLGRVSQEPLGL